MILQSPADPQPSMLHWRTIGESVEGRAIRLVEKAGTKGATAGGTLLIGGLHGDETATVLLLEEFCAQVLGIEPFRQAVAVLPLANPDSYVRASRYNARGVDLNRNCDHRWSARSVEPPGPEPWSEPETRALRDFIVAWQPRAIVALHWALAEIDADGEHSRALAQAMWEAIPPAERGPYRLRVSQTGASEAEPLYTACPGSFGQWCGYSLRYLDESRPAMITLELPYDPAVGSRPETLPEDHLETLRERWQRDADGYLRETRKAVWPMLLAACHFEDESS